MTDLEIANSVKPLTIDKVAKKMGLRSGDLEHFGDYKAKVKAHSGSKHGELILVTSINPTKSGLGKTTVSIGLTDALRRLKKNATLAIREPSLGPVFGLKGGATGGGYSQVIPMEDINLHFTGDLHAITSANNLLCSLIDNHIYHGNELDIDENQILFHRTIDICDRALRGIKVGYGAKDNKTERQEQFTITAGSEIMAICSLAQDMSDLKNRLGNILVAYSNDKKPVFARDLHAENALAILLKDVLKPNLVQTLSGSPALVHLGPFANIGHGCSSVIATKLAQEYSDYVITEAGFGADLGAEKFLDIKCRILKDAPSVVVLVVTLGALKLHGGVDESCLSEPNNFAILSGIGNLCKHIDTIINVFHLPLVVTLNRFDGDDEGELQLLKDFMADSGVRFVVNEAWAKGGEGALELAKAVIEESKYGNRHFKFAYELDESIEDKVDDIVQKVYGGARAIFSAKAKKSIDEIVALGRDKLPIVIAKTQYSLSDDMKKLGKPSNFEVSVRDVELKNGAEFIVVKLGTILSMPALQKTPNAIDMQIDEVTMEIKGLF